MYCLVDFRNRPQLQYTFRSRGKAREYLGKIKNNPLGVTAIYPDGRREYFEQGLPNGFLRHCDKSAQIKKGCHAKYKIRELNTIDGLRRNASTPESANLGNWRGKSVFSLFMLGNKKVYAGLAIVSLIVFSSSWYFQNQYGENAIAQSENAGNETSGRVAGAADEKIGNSEEPADSLQLADEEIIMSLLGKIEEAKQGEFETEILRYIKGRPMEKMAPYIAKQPRIVAAFIVGIAMKESKFGLYAPHSGGRDCYNYWGYKGRENTTASGYSCFNSPEHAIQVVGKKINSLVARGISNPAQMISWTCGSTCSWDNPENVRKWIADVGIYFHKINS